MVERRLGGKGQADEKEGAHKRAHKGPQQIVEGQRKAQRRREAQQNRMVNYA